MNTLLIYMVKVALYLAAFYAVYSILLSRDTMYSRNRIFILLSLLGSVVLPFITLQLKNPMNIPVFGRILSEVTITGDRSSALQTHLVLPGMLLTVYLTGLAFFATKLIADILSLFILMNRQRNRDGNIIKYRNLYTSGFSAFGKVFINEALTDEDAAEIIQHEQNHLKRNHFSDIIFIELLKAIQWFNPFIYLFDRSLRSVHEFQADEGCLRSGVPVVSYQKLIMNQVFKSRAFTITNSFSNPTLIKKRMIMMTKTRSKTLANLKILMVLPVIAILMIAISSCGGKTKPQGSTTEEIAPPPPPPPPPAATGYSDQKVIKGQPVDPNAPPPPPPPPPFEINNGDTTWIAVDEMPVFKDGDAGLLKFISENTKYPNAAKEAGIQGRVILQFTVTKDAGVEGAKVVKGVNPELDAEALRVVNKLVFEKPGFKDGKAVDVKYMIPITFTLK